MLFSINSRLFADTGVSTRYFNRYSFGNNIGRSTALLRSNLGIHLNAITVDRRLPKRPGGLGPLNDSALHQMRHVVPGDDAAHVVDAGHVAVREGDGAGIAVLGGEHAGQAAHTAAEFKDVPVPAEAAIPQQIVGQTLLGWPHAHVAGIVEADQLARREELAYPTYLYIVRPTVQLSRVLAPAGLALRQHVLQQRALQQTKAGEPSHRHFLVGLAAVRLRRACQRPGQDAPSTQSTGAPLRITRIIRSG